MRECRGCKRTLGTSEFASDTRTRCKGCELFTITLKNTRGRGAPLEMELDEVLEVFGASGSRRCFYCGIDEASYVSLRIPTPGGIGLRLGLDRIDSAAPYVAGNVVICCLVCNRIKSSTFTHDEMLAIGRAINESWRARGLDAVL